MGVDKNEIKEKAKKAFADAKNFSQKHELGKKFGIVALLAAAREHDELAVGAAVHAVVLLELDRRGSDAQDVGDTAVPQKGAEHGVGLAWVEVSLVD